MARKPGPAVGAALDFAQEFTGPVVDGHRLASEMAIWR
jgi:hypothetical protein